MSKERAGQMIRQAYAAFWKEWIILAIGVALVAAPVPLIIWVESKAGPNVFEGIPIEMIVQIIGAVAMVYALIVKIAYDLLANRYKLTDEEVVEIYGLIQKNRRVTKLEHIRNVSVEIGFIGRIFGFGDVLYYTSGSGGVDVRLKDIPKPEQLAEEADALAKRKQAEIKKEEDRNNAYKGQAGAAVDSQILDAFKQSVTESVTVQREILKAIGELNAETRKNAAILQSVMKESVPRGRSEPARSSGQASAERISASDPDSRQGREPSWNDTPEAAPLLHPDDDSPAAEEYEPEPTPKMFDGDWEEILAPGKEAEQSDEEPEARQDAEQTPKASDDQQYDAHESEDDSRSEAQNEFVGLMSPRQK